MSTYKKRQVILETDKSKTPQLIEGVEIHRQQLPDPKKHQIVSFIKSGSRILGYTLLPFSTILGVVILISSEAVGIYEELV